jgi:ATP-binding cassette subfamily B protein
VLADLELYAGVRNVLNARRLWQPIFGLLRPYAWKLLLLVALAGFSLAMTLVQPFLFRDVLDAALHGGARRDDLVRASSLLVVLGSLNVVSTLIAARYQGYLGQALLYDVQGRLFERVQRMPYGFFVHVNPGAVTTRVSAEASSAAYAVPSVVNGGFVALATLIFGSGLIAKFDPALALVLAFLLLFAVPARWVRRVIRGRLQDQYIAQGEYTAAMHERLSVSGALLTRLFGLHDLNARQFLKQAQAYRDLGVTVAMWQGLAQSLISIGTVIAIGAIALVGGVRVGAGHMTVGTLALLLFYVRILAAPIQAYSGIRFEMTRAMVAFSRVFEVLDFPQAIAFPSAVSATTPADSSVEFRGVRFAYPDPFDLAPPSLVQATAKPDDGEDSLEEVLRGVSFQIPPGGLTAIVGASGSGKSTIAALIARLFDVTEGQVTIGGADVRDIDQGTLTSTVSLVTQDTHLFHDTVRANLVLAKPDATDKEVVRACMAAGIHKLIRDLPAGYSTLVGERGVRFSGGQRQRIAFARAVLADPQVIVLDEATAHLDAESESLLRDAIGSILAARTRVVIAHRLSTVIDADQILVLDRGEIVDRGTHDDLMTRPGRYQELYRMQVSASTGDSELAELSST